MKRPPVCRPRRAAMDSLEQRVVLAAVQPTVFEQYMLELINRARANPAAEAARLGISLNEGLAADTLSPAARQPLAMNVYLNDAARGHSIWLRQSSLFQHAGAGNSTPQQRMAAAGYTFGGSSGNGENIGLILGSSLGDIADRTESLYRNLFVDAGVSGRGHRLNLLNASFEEVGLGIAQGAYTHNGNSNWTAIIATQDFAYRAGNPFLTGVIFKDTVRADDFYTPGEGLSGIAILATASDGATYSTTTNIAGGYTLQLPAGSYTIKATGTFGMGFATSSVVIGAENAKVDFKSTQFAVPPPPPPVPTNFSKLVSGILTVTGTVGNDVIAVTLEGSNQLKVTLGAGVAKYNLADVTLIQIHGLAGNDHLSVAENTVRCFITGGDGNDTILGGSHEDLLFGENGDDYIVGGGGNDTVWGGEGNDTLYGSGGKDYLYGEAGDDRLQGGGGADRLSGAEGNDRLYGEAGDDWLEGGGHVDRLYGGDGNDTLVGGSSNDRLYGDAGDDEMTGNHGNDYFDGGTGYNRVRDWNLIEIVLNAVY